MKPIPTMRDAMALLEARVAAPPKRLYHGTNIISACHIINDGEIIADDPIDSVGESVAVVCTSSSRKVARMFAVEFVRHNSRLDVGAVFILDGLKIAANLGHAPFESESAGDNNPEFEVRVEGDISLKQYLLGIKLVGDTAPLRRERFLERLWEDEGCPFGTFSAFEGLIERLLKASAKP